MQGKSLSGGRSSSIALVLALAAVAFVGPSGSPPAASAGNLVERGSRLFEDNPVVAQSLAALPDFAGMHLTSEHGLVVSMTREGMADAAIVASAFSGDAWYLQEVAWSAMELAAAEDAIQSAAPRLATEGVTVSATVVDWAHNVILVATDGEPRTADMLIRDLVGDVDFSVVDPIEVSVLSPPPALGDAYGEVVGEACVRRSSCSPLRSGLQLIHETSATDGGFHRCTSAFHAVDSVGRSGLLTAGHCRFSAQRPFTHGPFVLGPMASRVVGNHPTNTGSFVDAGFIPNTSLAVSLTPRVYENDLRQGTNITSRALTRTVGGVTFEAPLQGDDICIAGDTSGLSCGQVGPRLNLTGGQRQVPCANVTSQPGDSGAGMFWGNQARGLNWGFIVSGGSGVCGPGHSLFTPIRRLEQALGVTVVTR
jgi:hypothetical protein